MDTQIFDYIQNRYSQKKEHNIKKVKMIIAIDSKSSSSTIDRDEMLGKFGFYRKSPRKGLPLPESTYIGEIDSEDAGKELVQEIWGSLKDKGLEPTKISGGIIDDWKVIYSKDEIK